MKTNAQCVAADEWLAKALAGALAVLLAGLLGACATPPAISSEVTAQTTGPSAGLGIVFGRTCTGTGFEVRQLSQDGASFRHVGEYGGRKTAFAMQLPPGRYAFISMDSHTGPVVPARPLAFDVQGGKIQYIGTLLPRWPLKKPADCAEEERHLVNRTMWADEGSPVHPPIRTVDIADDMPVAIADAKASYPKVDYAQAVNAVAGGPYERNSYRVALASTTYCNSAGRRAVADYKLVRDGATREQLHESMSKDGAYGIRSDFDAISDASLDIVFKADNAHEPYIKTWSLCMDTLGKSAAASR